MQPPALVVGDAITSISAVGGTPMKVAGQAQVRDARGQPADYFVADTDTSHGSSGGGAFDDALSLVGVLARGGTDLTGTPDGCYTTFVSDGAAAEEHFNLRAPGGRRSLRRALGQLVVPRGLPGPVFRAAPSAR